MTPTAATYIPLSIPQIQGNEWRYIKECLDTGWVSSVGGYVERFERELAARARTQYAIATVNGTAALHIALLVAAVEAEDEVLVPSLTFIATANAVRYIGAWPVFMDAEPCYWQMDPEKVASFLEQECIWRGEALWNRKTGRRIRAIMPVHLLGHPTDMDPLLQLAHQYNLPVIEDATESLGATYHGRSTGQLGHIACFSFNGNKIITTGGGGMIVTDNEAWARRAKYLTTQAKDDPVEYVHHEIGYNYRLTNLQAAMGCAQLEQLDSYIATKRRIAQTYDDAFASVPGLVTLPEAAWAFSIKWMYTILLDEMEHPVNRRELHDYLHHAQIQSRPLWQPLHLSQAHQDSQAYHCDVAEDLHQRALSLPCSVGLTNEDQARVVDACLQGLTKTSA